MKIVVPAFFVLALYYWHKLSAEAKQNDFPNLIFIITKLNDQTQPGHFSKQKENCKEI